MTPKRPNILFILTDQMRADHWGGGGHPVVQTPSLDRLAGEGVTFDNAFCCSPVCVPARSTLLTGRYPFQHRVYKNVQTLPEAEFSFASALKSAGYKCMAVGRTHNIDNGFQTVPIPINDSFPVDAAKYPPFGVSVPYGEGGEVETSPAHLEDYLDVRAARVASEFLRDLRGKQPFCLFLGLLAPHNPFYVPRPFDAMYRPDQVIMPAAPPDGHVPPAFADTYAKHAVTRAEAAHRRLAAAYYGLVSMVDLCVGRVLDTLNQSGLAEDTLVIFHSDHGELLGDKGMYAKMQPYEGSVRVPLVLRGPSFRGGGRVSGLVEQVDVTSTILAAAGLAQPEHLSGRPLQRLTEGVPGREYVFSEMYDWRMVRDRRYKLVLHRDGHGELYDLERDPCEAKNLYSDPACRDTRERLLMMVLHHLFCWQDRASVNFPESKQAAGAFVD